MRDQADDLFWALGFLVIGTGIVTMWTAPVPDWFLWVGYFSLGLVGVFLVRWFVKGDKTCN